MKKNREGNFLPTISRHFVKANCLHRTIQIQYDDLLFLFSPFMAGPNRPKDNPRVSVRQIERFGNEHFDSKIAAIIDRGISSNDQGAQSYAAAMQHGSLGQDIDCRDVWRHVKAIESAENEGNKDEALRSLINSARADLQANLKFGDDMRAFKSKDDAERLTYGKSLLTDLLGRGQVPSITTINALAAKAGSYAKAKRVFADFAKEGLRTDAVSTTIMLKFAMTEGNRGQAEKLITELEASDLDPTGKRILDGYKKKLAEVPAADAAE